MLLLGKVVASIEGYMQVGVKTEIVLNLFSNSNIKGLKKNGFWQCESIAKIQTIMKPFLLLSSFISSLRNGSLEDELLFKLNELVHLTRCKQLAYIYFVEVRKS